MHDELRSRNKIDTKAKQPFVAIKLIDRLQMRVLRTIELMAVVVAAAARARLPNLGKKS